MTLELNDKADVNYNYTINYYYQTLCKRWKLQHVTNELNNEIWPRTYRKGVLKCNILPGSYPLRGSWQGDEVIEDHS